MEEKSLFHALENSRNEDQAIQMSQYMRNLFPFLGIQTKQRRDICKPFFKQAKQSQQVDWAFVEQCWQMNEREYQYVAIDYLLLLQSILTPNEIPVLNKLITTKSWWDTVDGLDGVIGNIALRFPEVNKTMLDWSTDANIWLRRVAIDHQLSRKQLTDTKLLEQILINNFGESEFFICKAIGWSLRDYSKTNPEWVKDFIERYREQLAPLSIREGSKYL